MNKNTRNGLFALGLAAVAAWYKMSPEQKAKVKNKVSGLGDRLRENLPENLKNFGKKQTDTAS